MRGLVRVSRVIDRAVVLAIVGLTGAMFCAVFAQVVFRYMLVQPLPWSEELARYLMIWAACLAASEAYARGSHIGVNLLVDSVRPSVRKVMVLWAHLAVSVLMGLIVVEGFRFSASVWVQDSPALEIPMTWPYLAVPVGAALILRSSLTALFQQAAGAAAPEEADARAGKRRNEGGDSSQ